jgi:hypothetical protein
MGPNNVVVSGTAQGVETDGGLHVELQCSTEAAGILGNTWLRCGLLGANGVRYSAPEVNEPQAPSVTTTASLDIPLQSYQLCILGGNSGQPLSGSNPVGASGCFAEL